MSDYVTLILIALGLSADAFAVTISNAMCFDNLTKMQKLSMPTAFGLFQGAMPLLGYFLGSLFAEQVQAFDHWLALILLLFLGIKAIVETAVENKADAVECEEKQTKQFTLKKLLVQSVATSIDALAVGVTLSVTVNISIWISVSIIAAVTFVVCLAGLLLGATAGKMLKKYSGYVGGAILIAIGLKIFLEHIIGG